MDFLNLLDFVLEKFQISDRSFSAYFAATLLIIQVIALVALASFVIWTRLKRMVLRRRSPEKEQFFRERIKIISLEDDFTKQYHEYELLKRRLKTRRERGFFRRVLIESITKFRDRSRLSLLALYRELGFLEEDRLRAKSQWWWTRLEVVMRIEKLEWKEATKILEDLIHDPHDLVALGAIRALSALSNPDLNLKLLEEMGRRAPTRQDLYLGILHRIGKAEPGSLVRYLDLCFDPLHASFAILALGRLQIFDALPILIQLAKSSSDEVARSVAEALGIMKSVEGSAALENLLSHPSAEVRAQALLSLVPLNPSKRRFNDVQQLSSDPSVEVQRALFEVQQLMVGTYQ